MDWLRMVRDHVANSFCIERDDLEMSPFDGQGGPEKCISYLVKSWNRCW